MPARPVLQAEDPNELRIEIPKLLFEQFQQQPRILIKWRPDGLWPIDPGSLRKLEWLQKLAENPEFNEGYEVVIMAKGR